MRVTFPSFDASVPTDARRGARDSVITGCGYLFSPPGSPVGRPLVVVMECVNARPDPLSSLIFSIFSIFSILSPGLT